MRSLLYFGLSVLFFSCTADADKPASEAFGAAFDLTNIRPAESLIATYSQQELSDSVRTTLRGTVHEVCQAKGCWMTVMAGSGEEMTVTFKDYGFFVPKDISGQEVIMHGLAYTQLTPVEELRHFAQDAGQSAEEIASITEPRRELRFLAEGVTLPVR